jgi:ABC-2 type transport system ATP-binding protein
MSIFSCENLTKQYPKSKFQLKNITLALEPGRITGIVGENGNGKTTLLRIIAGELNHDSGELKFFDKIVNADQNWQEIRSRIAYIPQRIPKWYGLLRTNLIFQASILNITGAEADELVDGLVEKLGLTEYADLKWSEISTGYRLRFQLARMLIGSPDLLVLDEPIANLDINAQSKFLSDLREIVNEPGRQVSVILSSQQLHEIENVSDDVVFLKNGALLFAGDVNKIGETRTQNEFEIQVNIDLEQLLTLWPEASMERAGKTAHIKLPLTVTSSDFIQAVLKEGGQILYFRDISSSTRRLFNA